jgi:hypothetical protein
MGNSYHRPLTEVNKNPECDSAHTALPDNSLRWFVPLEKNDGEAVREIDTTRPPCRCPTGSRKTRLPLFLLSIFPGSYLVDTAGDTLDSDPKYRVHLIIQPSDFPYAAVVNPKCAPGSAGILARIS